MSLWDEVFEEDVMNLLNCVVWTDLLIEREEVSQAVKFRNTPRRNGMPRGDGELVCTSACARATE